jgi:hypothetical protein
MSFKRPVAAVFAITILIFTGQSAFALEPISEEGLARVTGQNGVSLSGELSFNENGGPLTSGDTGNLNPLDGTSVVWGTCTEKDSTAAERCGARLAIKPNETNGWLVLDELKGSISFEGLTLRSRDIDQATDNFGGDEVDAHGRTVLEIGLPNEVKFDNFSYSYVTSTQARPTDAGHQQQIRHGIDFNGSVQMQGNLLVFPTGNP